MSESTRILVIVTNAGQYEKVGYRTGLWLGELTHFYDYVTDHGCQVDIASPVEDSSPSIRKASPTTSSTNSEQASGTAIASS